MQRTIQDCTGEKGLLQITSYLPENLQKITSYLPEDLRKITSFLPVDGGPLENNFLFAGGK